MVVRLKKCIEMAAYPQAVKYYTQAAVILSQYEHVDSFRGMDTSNSLLN